jgi:hypothetical protein
MWNGTNPRPQCSHSGGGSVTVAASLISTFAVECSLSVGKAAGPKFTRQNVVDEVNKITDYTAGCRLAAIDWTIAHAQTASQGCGVLSQIHNGKFVPKFSAPGTPFICFQANPSPDRLQLRPTLK